MPADDTELRELVLEAKGYLPYVARVEPLHEDRTLAVALVPVPEVAPAVVSSSAAAAPPAKAAPEPVKARRPAASTRPPAGPSGPPVEAPPPTEIHLSR